MEVWLTAPVSNEHEGVDAFYSVESGLEIYSEDGLLYRNGAIIGGHVHIDSAEAQAKARSLAGSVEWILLTFEDWSMIPIENVIAATESTPTKVAAQIMKPVEAQGAGFALDIGVDALLCSEDCLESALIVKSIRLAKSTSEDSSHEDHGRQIDLSLMTITDIQQGHSGDRVCVDLLSMLDEGEGMLVGSTAKAFVLIHGETIQSKYVPTRPFRVNAGSVDAYTYMADGTTKYLSELTSGDEVLITGSDGTSRQATIARMKIETRPFILLRYKDENANEGHVFIQQAETVRLVLQNCEACSVTDLSVGDCIFGHSFTSTRHVGQSISAPSEER
ncbi:MAG: 3-dehydroquinate synthase II [Candidatus Thermoplasmatota archaeon]|nr:3-dehydroquinate synthase II [Candidatus Thermoplasmatota archaeon]